MKTTPCKSCGKPIFFKKSAKSDALIPIDAEPVQGGNIYVVDDLAYVKSGDMLEEMMQGPTYQSHYVTCPNAARHRKGKEQGDGSKPA